LALLLGPRATEPPAEATPIGPLILHGKVHSGHSGTVFYASVHDRPVVAKYAHDCFEKLRIRKSHVHPLVYESEFLYKLNTTGLTPAIFHLSPPEIPLKDIYSTEWLLKNWETCEPLQPEGRFIVIDRVGPSVDSFIRSEIHTKSATRESTRMMLVVVRKAAGLLERLHAEGIVHGDFHFGNTAFKNRVVSETNLENEDLVLIDFQYSQIVNESEKKTKKSGLPPRHLSLPILSVWQLEEEAVRPRDDMYRLLMHTAFYMSRGALMARMNSRAPSDTSFDARVSKLLYFHRRENLFADIKVEAGVDTLLTASVIASLDRLLQGIVKSHEVPYQFIQEKLNAVINLLS